MLKLNSLFVVILAIFVPSQVSAYDSDAYLETNLLAFEKAAELTPEALSQVTLILEDSVARQETILSDYGIVESSKFVPDQRLDTHQSRKLKRELSAVHNETLTQLSYHLTDDQLQVYRDMSIEQREVVKERLRSHH